MFENCCDVEERKLSRIQRLVFEACDVVEREVSRTMWENERQL